MSNERKEWVGWKLVEAVSKIGVPLGIAALVYGQTMSIASLERENRHSELLQRETYQETSIDLELTKLVLQRLLDGSEQQRAQALDLVETFRPQLRLRLAQVIEGQESSSQALRARARRVREAAGEELFTSFEVDIYYDQPHAILAQEIAKWLRDTVGVRKVILAEENREWLRGAGLLRGVFEIRYEVAMESLAARELASRLQESFASQRFTLRSTTNRTPDSLSIFIFEDAETAKGAGA